MADQPVLGLGVRSLLDAGRRLGYEFEVICDHPLNVIRVARNGAGFLFQTWPGFITLRRRADYGSLVDKSAQKALLAASGLPVPRLLACVANGDELAEANVTFPCVAKPCLGTYSRAVFTHIFTPEVLRAAVSRVTGRDGADFIDASDRVHPDTVKLCEAFARRQRLFMAGFDLIPR